MPCLGQYCCLGVLQCSSLVFQSLDPTWNVLPGLVITIGHRYYFNHNSCSSQMSYCLLAPPSLSLSFVYEFGNPISGTQRYLDKNESSISYLARRWSQLDGSAYLWRLHVQWPHCHPHSTQFFHNRM